MLLLVLILVMIAFGLLVVALIAGTALWAWVSVGVSVLAAGVLLIDWLRRRSAVRSNRDAAAVESYSAVEGYPLPQPVYDEPMTEAIPVIRMQRPVPEETVVIDAVQSPSGSTGQPSSARTGVPLTGGNSSRSVVTGPDVAPVDDAPSFWSSDADDHASASPETASSAGATGQPPVTQPPPVEPAKGEAPSVAKPAEPAAPAASAATAAAALAAAAKTAVTSKAATSKVAATESADSEQTMALQATAGEDHTAAIGTPGDVTAAAPDAAEGAADQTEMIEQPNGVEETVVVAAAGGKDATVDTATAEVSTAAVQAPESAAAEQQPDDEQTTAVPTSSGGAAADPAAAGTAANSAAGPATPADAAEDAAGADNEAGSLFDAGTVSLPPAGAEPGEEVRNPADAAVVAELDDEVVVVDELPRYHVSGCRFLPGRDVIPIPVREAVELGFTPCGWCSPDRTLSSRHRATSSR